MFVSEHCQLSDWIQPVITGDNSSIQISYLTGLCQAHAHSEAGRHARREGGGQRAAQTRIDHPNTSDHRLYYQLTTELFHAINFFRHFPAGHEDKKKKLLAATKLVVSTQASNNPHTA